MPDALSVSICAAVTPGVTVSGASPVMTKLLRFVAPALKLSVSAVKVFATTLSVVMPLISRLFTLADPAGLYIVTVAVVPAVVIVEPALSERFWISRAGGAVRPVAAESSGPAGGTGMAGITTGGASTLLTVTVVEAAALVVVPSLSVTLIEPTP